MPGISPAAIEHLLNVNSVPKSVVKKIWHIEIERCEATTFDVQKLLDAQFIREYHYLEWVSNIVLVKTMDDT